MTRTQIVASAIGAAMLAVAIPVSAGVVTTTTPVGTEGCHVSWADSETGALLGWADSPSEPCLTFTGPPDAIFTPVVIDTGDGHATTGRAEAAPCLADGDCIEVIPGVRVAAHEAPAVAGYLQAVADAAELDALDGWLWRAIADCESGGNPRAISPSGLDRGLYQFRRRSWAAVGGQGDPVDATVGEQTRRARLLLDLQGGESAWGTCWNRAVR